MAQETKSKTLGSVRLLKRDLQDYRICDCGHTKRMHRLTTCAGIDQVGNARVQCQCQEFRLRHHLPDTRENHSPNAGEIVGYLAVLMMAFFICYLGYAAWKYYAQETGFLNVSSTGLPEVPVARDADSLNEMRRAIRAQDKDWLASLMRAEKYFMVPDGTRVAILERGMRLFPDSFSMVRIIEGEHAGKQGYVAEAWMAENYVAGTVSSATRQAPPTSASTAKEAARDAVKSAIAVSDPGAIVGEPYDSETKPTADGGFRTVVPVFNSAKGTASAECLATKSGDGWTAQVIRLRR